MQVGLNQAGAPAQLVDSPRANNNHITIQTRTFLHNRFPTLLTRNPKCQGPQKVIILAQLQVLHVCHIFAEFVYRVADDYNCSADHHAQTDCGECPSDCRCGGASAQRATDVYADAAASGHKCRRA
jgi:hypothetical protein